MSTHSDMQDWTKALEAEVEPDNEPVEVKILDRNGEPYRDADGNPAVIYALGKYSDAVKAHDSKKRRQRSKAVQSGKRIREDDEEMTIQTAERVAAATTGWRLAIGGVDVPFNRQNAIALYTKAEWVADQVWAAMHAHADFFEEKSSS